MLHQAKALAIVFFALLSFTISAQSLSPVQLLVQQARESGSVFSPVPLFEKAAASDERAARFAQDAQFLTIDENRLAILLTDRPKSLSLILPYNHQYLTIDLVQVDPFASDFTVLGSEVTSEPQTTRPGMHYRGILRGSEHSIAAFSFFADDVLGIVSDEHLHNLVLGKVQRPGNQRSFMFYSDLELAMDNPFECNILEMTTHANQAVSISERSNGHKSLRVNLEADQKLYLNRGSIQAVINYLSGTFNQVCALYANEQVDLELAQILVWVTPDPYADANSNIVLERFRQQRKASGSNLSILAGLAGYNQESAAYLDALCTPDYAVAYTTLNVSYSNVPTYSWGVEVLAHEIGHNLGAHHTQWCGWPGGAIDPCQLAERGCAPGRETVQGSTIMSYCPLITSGIDFSKGFGALPGGLIRSKVNAAPCLSTYNFVNTLADNRTFEMTTETLNLTPNPASKQVNVQLHFNAATNARVALIDLVGRTLQTQLVNQADATLHFDLSGIQKGIYLVQVFENEQLVATKRLIKN